MTCTTSSPVSPLKELLELDLPLDIQAFFIQSLFTPPPGWLRMHCSENKQVWQALSPLLEAHGFLVQSAHPKLTEDSSPNDHILKQPRNPFNPQKDEDFVAFASGKRGPRMIYTLFSPLVRLSYALMVSCA